MTFQTAAVKPVACCNNPENLVRVVERKDRGYDQCRVCGRKHYGMKVDLADILSRASAVSLQRPPVAINPLLTTVVDVYTR